jgi:hypothetical protein
MTTPKNFGLKTRSNLGELTRAKSDNEIRTPLTNRLAATEKRPWLLLHRRGRVPLGRARIADLSASCVPTHFG